MSNYCFKAFISAVLLTCTPVVSAQIIINELMQSNIDCIMDDLNEFPDSWVELYNVGSTTENLGAYRLSDSEKIKKAYILPDKDIAPGEFVVVYCDKEGEGLHASFRLDSGKGGSVYLFHNEEIVDKVENWKKQPAPNIAYGREVDGSDNWGYQAVPTPGTSNCGTLYKDILEDPIFSVGGRVITSDLVLTLSIPEDAPEGTIIRYTLDGKEPTSESQVYSAPFNITGTTTVRAKLFCDGYLSPRSLTHSYINHPRELTLPLVSIVTDDDYMYSDKHGILVKGTYTRNKPNYEYDWRRPINFEYFGGIDSDSQLNQLCETRVKGGATRGNSLKSLAVYANKRFGTKRFNYEFFPDQTPGIDEFKSFEMRNSGNDFDYLYMRDAIIQQSVGMYVDLDWQASRPAILYINGVYKGILNIRPRSNEDYVYSYYDGLEDLDLIENWGTVKEGSIDNFNSFKQFYSTPGHTYEEYQEVMDTEEFCNLMIMNIFYDNKDFPGNNLILWRPTAEDGKWRWIAKDTDFGLGLYGERYNYPTLNWITTPGYDNNRNSWANYSDAVRLFSSLLEVPEFRDMFIDRAAIYLGDFLTPEMINAKIDKRYDELKFEYKYHRDLINPWWPNYSQEITNAKKWVNQRWSFFYTHMSTYFGISSPVNITIESGSEEGRKLIINDISVISSTFNGKYYPGRRLTVKSASENDGLCVTGWEVKIIRGPETSTVLYDTEILDFDMPGAEKIEIKPILSEDPASIDEIRDDINWNSPCDIYDLLGRSLGSTLSTQLSSLTPGVYLLRQGPASRKIIVR